MTQLQTAPAARPFALGSGEGERIWFLNSEMTIKATAATTGGELFLMETHIPEGFPPHCHGAEEELFVVLEGDGTLELGEERLPMRPGSVVSRPAGSGVAHTFRAVGEARILTIAVPGGVEGFFRGVGRPAEGPGLPPPGPVDVAAIKQVAAQFNNELVGPPLGP